MAPFGDKNPVVIATVNYRVRKYADWHCAPKRSLAMLLFQPNAGPALFPGKTA